APAGPLEPAEGGAAPRDQLQNAAEQDQRTGHRAGLADANMGNRLPMSRKTIAHHPAVESLHPPGPAPPLPRRAGLELSSPPNAPQLFEISRLRAGAVPLGSVNGRRHGSAEPVAGGEAFRRP